MDIAIIYQYFLKCSGVSIDTRTIQENQLFVALRGENFNGNIYAKKAIESGARFVLVDDEKYYDPNNEAYVLVENSLKTLQLLAMHHRKQFNIPVLAITGTNGKTTTKELIASVLNTQNKVLATKGNLNNHIGVPLTLLELGEEYDIAVIEMGANHIGEIAQLCEIALPDYGIITNIGTAHIEGFGSFEGVVKAKTELYKYLKAHNKFIFYNIDNEILSDNIDHNKNMCYGTTDKADVVLTEKKAEPYLSIKLKSFENEIITRLAGLYNAENVLAAITISLYFNITKNNIYKAIRNYEPKNNRSQITKTENNTLILDLYNANPTSMKAALENFYAMQTSNKAIILGDMFELGDISKQEHLKIITLIDKMKFNEVFLVGSIFSSLNTKYKSFSSSKEINIYLNKNKIKSYTILIKGSRGVALETIISNL